MDFPLGWTWIIIVSFVLSEKLWLKMKKFDFTIVIILAWLLYLLLVLNLFPSLFYKVRSICSYFDLILSWNIFWSLRYIWSHPYSTARSGPWICSFSLFPYSFNCSGPWTCSLLYSDTFPLSKYTLILVIFLDLEVQL